MSNPIIVHKGRTNVITVGLGMDVSSDTFFSEIRTESDSTSTLIATWDVTFVTDGSDGELLLTLDDSVTAAITYSSGLMDIKRVTAGEPVSVFDAPVEVVFKGTVTA